MTEFTIHTKETATVEARGVMEAAEAKHGRVVNLIGGMAEAPALAEAYMTMGTIVQNTSFTPTERHVVWFTINAEHGCDYCMAAHTGIAKSENIPQDVVNAARAVTAQPDPKLEALRQFTLAAVRQRGWVEQRTIEEFIQAGFTKQQVLEVIVIIAHKVLSNYTNHIVRTPLDNVFQPFAWQQPSNSTSA